MESVEFQLNEHPVRVECDVTESLLFTLRERLGHYGTKGACEQGECGSCSVLLDGEVVCACMIPTTSAAGTTITTIEGLREDELAARLQRSMAERGAVQCGFCTPGIVVASVSLLRRNAAPTWAEIKEALSGNLCRCTGYVKILEAVEAAAARGINP